MGRQPSTVSPCVRVGFKDVHRVGGVPSFQSLYCYGGAVQQERFVERQGVASTVIISEMDGCSVVALLAQLNASYIAAVFEDSPY